MALFSKNAQRIAAPNESRRRSVTMYMVLLRRILQKHPLFTQWISSVLVLEALLIGSIMIVSPDFRQEPLELAGPAFALLVLAAIARLICIVVDQLHGYWRELLKGTGEHRGFEVVLPEERREPKK
jgi:hypothetical protein